VLEAIYVICTKEFTEWSTVRIYCN